MDEEKELTYYEKNKERLKAYQRQYYKDNLDKIKAYDKTKNVKRREKRRLLKQLVNPPKPKKKRDIDFSLVQELYKKQCKIRIPRGTT
jgi:hypothetical protein